MKTQTKIIMYICAGRSFLSSNPGRKIFSVVAAWRKSGYQVDHYCGGDFTQLKDAVNKQDLERRAYRRRIDKKGLSLFILNSLAEMKDILHDMKMWLALRNLEKSPAIIWERSSRLHQVGMKLAKKYKCPYVLEWKDHLIPYQYSLFIHWARQVERCKLAKAQYIVVESNVLREYLVNECKVTREKIIVAHNAVDMEIFANNLSQIQCRDKYKLPQDKLIVGYIGSYAFYHQADLMVAVAQYLVNEDIEIVMVGDGKDYEQVRALAEQTQVINQNMRFMARVDKDKVPEILACLDVAVLPGSTDIICPIKIQEYMAMGLATIAPDYICNREIIHDELNALLFKPNNAQDLGDKIKRLQDQQLRTNLGRKAKQHMAENFSWQKTWVRALDIVTQDQ